MCSKSPAARHAFVLDELGHPLGDGVVVGEHSAQPALIDEGHSHALGVTADRLLSLLLGSNEQNRAAFCDSVAYKGVGLLDSVQGLNEVDHIDAATLAVDESLHLGIPTAGLVSEVDA